MVLQEIKKIICKTKSAKIVIKDLNNYLHIQMINQLHFY